MVIVENTLHFRVPEPTVVSIGKFDGIHRGHMEIIKEMLAFQRLGFKTLIVTFAVSPQKALHMDTESCVLTTNREKRRIFSELGIDYYVELPFDDEVMRISPGQFLKQILLERLQMQTIVCGRDCRFGYKGLGDVSLLKKMGKELSFETVVVDDVFWNNKKISSSLIREELLAGRIENANEMLTQPYLFYGKVVHGQRLGRTLGMPTVNLIPESDKLLPPKGVYYSRVIHMGREYRAITNIGSKPTVDGEKPAMGLESYLYHFSEEIYGDFLFVSLYHYVREEIKFDSVEDLKKQMQSDIALGEAWHKEHI